MLANALPFAIALTFPVLFAISATLGGVWISAVSVYALIAIPLVDYFIGASEKNLDANTGEDELFWHKLITWIWAPLQFTLIVALLWLAGSASHLSDGELIRLAVATGIITGGVGITYAHELVHQTNRFERGLGEALLTSTLYGHFAVEHVHGHHVHVGTPKDPVSARFNESFWAFLPRAVGGSFVSAWRITADRLARRGLPLWHSSNPFWRYGAATIAWFFLAYMLAGWFGVGLFALQGVVAFAMLEAVNYVEHYGLSRRLLPDGKYERVAPHHSWNTSNMLTNYFLINLQRHSDHHYRPQRRYPVLQHYDESKAPQLPYGYPAMLTMALLPPLWFRVMNPKVEAWRARHYPAAA
ncbi:MAG: alkane 1-monooxygenase [Chitinophagales bacterium]|nr:alkane 1-monooxygenase [Hyphomicrobiales bacterium]